MTKKLLALLLAGLLVTAFTACKDGDDTTTTTNDGTSDIGVEDSYIVVGTDSEGNDITEAATQAPSTETDAFDPSETNPTFTDVDKKIVVFAGVATVRTSTVLNENNGVGWPSEGKILNANGESDNWYRITYLVGDEEQTCYIAKTVAGDAAVLDSFTDVDEEEVEVIVDAVNIRSYPSASSSNSIRTSLKKGAKVTRVAVSENWSRILFEVTSETETDAEGNAKVEIKQYYISNDCIKAPEAATDAATTEAATAEATVATTEVAN